MEKPIMIFDSNKTILSINDKVKLDGKDDIFDVASIEKANNSIDIVVSNNKEHIKVYRKPRTSMNFVVFNNLTRV